MKKKFSVISNINIRVFLFTIIYIFVFNFITYVTLALFERFFPIEYLYIANIVGLIINLIFIVLLYKKYHKHTSKIRTTNWKVLLLIFLSILVFKISIDPILNIYTMFEGGKLKVFDNEIPLIFKLTNLLCFSILTPIIEELFFRGILLEKLLLKKKKRIFSIVYSSILFTIIHINFLDVFNSPIVTIIVSLLVGIITGYIYTITRNIIYPILFHMLNNVFAFIIFNIYHKNYITNINNFDFGYKYWFIVFISISVFVFLIFKINRVIKNKI